MGQHPTLDHLKECMPVFNKKHEWPPQNPDCNPMDYAIWDFFMADVYRDRAEMPTEQELKDAIVRSWQRITLEQIRSSSLHERSAFRLFSVKYFTTCNFLTVILKDFSFL